MTIIYIFLALLIGGGLVWAFRGKVGKGLKAADAEKGKLVQEGKDFAKKQIDKI